MKASKLLEYLLELDKVHDLSKVDVYYRTDRDSDDERIHHVEEDLFDEETNSNLISIMFLNNDSNI